MSDLAKDPLTITITRTVKPENVEQFETLVKAFIPKSLTFPGHMGVHVAKPASGHSREYHVVLKFANREQWNSFVNWPEYVEFRRAIEPLLEREPCVEELSGLESWFTLPSSQSIHPLPRWKMACLTMLAVYPTSMLLGETLGRWLHDWPIWFSRLLMAACMVVLLAWVVMPLLTRIFANWLYGPAARPEPKKCPE